MSITFPTFIDKEIVTPEKLNDFVQALEAKFAAGLSSAEIQWPLSAGGNLEMGDNEITGGIAIWGIYNAAQYQDDWDACLVAGTDGCIVIPPNTTITMDGAAMAGSSLTIRGSGPTSVLQLESGASAGWALKNNNAGFSFNLSNLTMDGASIASRGIILQGVDDVVINKVHFKDFALAPIQIIKSGSTESAALRITDNHFEGSTEYHIEGESVRDLIISDNIFETASKTAVMLTSGSATSLMKRVEINDNVFKSCSGTIIDVQGYDGNYNVYQGHIKVHGNLADNTNAINVGDDTHKLRHVTVSDNIVPSSATNGLNVSAEYGTVSGNIMPGATADGCDLLSSQNLIVKGNSFRDAGAAGIRFVDTEDCMVHGNDCLNYGTTAIIRSDSITNPSSSYDNSDQPESLPVNMYMTDTKTLTVPAGVIKKGDCVEVWTHFEDDRVGQMSSSLGGQAIASCIGQNSQDQAFHHAIVVVYSTTEFTSHFESGFERASYAKDIGVYNRGGIDLSSDVLITCPASATEVSCRITAQITRGVIV